MTTLGVAFLPVTPFLTAKSAHMFLIDLAAILSEWVLRLAPKRWQRAIEPDSVLGVAMGFMVALAVIAAVVAAVVLLRN